MTPGSKERLDEAVVRLELAPTRSKARAMVMAGDVLVNDLPVIQAGYSVRATDVVSLKSKPRFVSRGGEKLDHALEVFNVDADDLICADFGASTGGFTDCLLQRGAKRVYAIDVGYGQLDQRIRDDERVVVQERVNARYIESLPEPIDLVVIDVSFISLSLILPVAKLVLTHHGQCVPLVKPQFEAGRNDVGKGGVVRDPAIHRRVLVKSAETAIENGFAVRGITKSPIVGPAGNIEFLMHLVAGEAEPPAIDEMVGKALAE
jgi:23S rRNA (cytidine1920-2'-O)/16S rRNA (cytidine1409-2'-O)-methyltransferase